MHGKRAKNNLLFVFSIFCFFHCFLYVFIISVYFRLFLMISDYLELFLIMSDYVLIITSNTTGNNTGNHTGSRESRAIVS